MNPAEIAEIRARLQTVAGDERRRPRNPLLGSLRVLMRPPAPPPPPRPNYPAPRRVGLTPTVILDEDAELLLTQPVGPAPAEAESSRRNAFGQRPGPAEELTALLLAPLLNAPDPTPADVAEAEARWNTILAQPGAAAAVAETPFHPEDVADHPDVDAEQVYAAAGLPQLDPAAPRARPKPRIRREPDEAASPPAAPIGPEQELLTHVERVVLAELAAFEALRLSA